MKNLLIALMAALIFHGSAVFAATLGEAAPDFAARDMNGHDVRLSDYKGRIVVLEWTSNECPFVKKHYDSGNMQRLQKEEVAKGVIWLSVDSSGKDHPGYMDGTAAAEWIKTRAAMPTDFIIDDDGAVGHLYGAKTTPHMFVIDKKGKLAYAGAIDDKASANPADIAGAKNYVAAAIDDLEAGKPVATDSTQSYGCSVKYGQ